MNVAILNNVLAKRPWFTVVGISGNVRYVQNNGFVMPAESGYYLPLRHSAAFIDPQERVILRTSLSPTAVAVWMRSTVASLDPTVPVMVDSMSQHVSKLEARPRFNAALLGIFAAMGILLAAIGTYGVLAFLVVQRTREIGIRMALGAHPRDVMKLILGQGAKLAVAGLLTGMAGAFFLTRLLTSLLFGVQATDPVIFAGVAISLLFVALVACYIPARRAMRVDPFVALRYE